MAVEGMGRTTSVEVITGSPETIYTYVIDGVRDVIRTLDVQAEDAEDEVVQSEIVAGLHLLQAKVAGKQEELKASADWRHFTVALYGETNAGKSTIIESLRIHLGEPAKLAERQQYDELKAAHGLGEDALATVRDAIDAARTATVLASSRSEQLTLAAPVELQALQEQIERERQQTLAVHAARPWWKKLLGFFQRGASGLVDPMPQLVELQQRQQQQLQLASAEVAAAEAALLAAQDTLDRRMRMMPELLANADGGIIGDGRPDFTRATQRYVFNGGTSPIVLLDVPGIEGGEKDVKDHIDKAVQTAHAVFYVTGKAAQPQHGDKEDGTLEKIKRHLGPQTEVWAVFNKRVAGPMPLRNGGDLFASDADGMDDLSAGLRIALGANFKGVLPVSAYPAFLALADRLPPMEALNDEQKSLRDRNTARAKFLSEFDTDALLERTGFAAMARHLSNMAVDAPRKIRLANIHKASQSLQDVVAGLEHHAVSMEAHANKVTTETTAVQSKVDIAEQQLVASLRSESADALRNLETTVRRYAYELVESGIGNDELKSKLQQRLEECAEEMQEVLGKTFKETVGQFQGEILHAAERFQKHLKDLDQVAGEQMREMGVPTFTMDLKVDNGVSVVGLVTTAMGAALMLFTGPAGWVVISLSAIGVVLSLAKAIRGLFDTDFKKSQQRKAIDESLASATKSIRADLEKSERKVRDAVETACVEAKKRLAGPQRSIKTQAAVLRLSVTRLRALSTSIDTTLA